LKSLTKGEIGIVAHCCSWFKGTRKIVPLPAIYTRGSEQDGSNYNIQLFASS
jgi:hypothetical protein